MSKHVVRLAGFEHSPICENPSIAVVEVRLREVLLSISIPRLFASVLPQKVGVLPLARQSRGLLPPAPLV